MKVINGRHAPVAEPTSARPKQASTSDGIWFSAKNRNSPGSNLHPSFQRSSHCAHLVSSSQVQTNGPAVLFMDPSPLLDLKGQLGEDLLWRVSDPYHAGTCVGPQYEGNVALCEPCTLEVRSDLLS